MIHGGEDGAVASRGVIWLAVGEAFVAEAAVSAASMRRHLRLPSTIFTDRPRAARATGCFDDVVEIVPSGPRPHRDKLLAMRDSPYEETLFLDTDTFVGAPLDDAWELLGRFDLAAAIDRGYVDRFPAGTGVPDVFKEPNLGVVFFRRSPAMTAMLDEATAIYDRFAAPGPGFASAFDQPPLRVALYRSDLRFAPLQDEDNCRFANYGKLNGPVRVLHGRLRRAPFDEATLSRLLARMNATTVPRVFVAGRVLALWPRRLKASHEYRARRMPAANLVDPRLLAATFARRLRALFGGRTAG